MKRILNKPDQKFSFYKRKVGHVKLNKTKLIVALEELFGKNLSHISMSKMKSSFSSQICKKLNIIDSKMNRQRLYNIWRRNRLNGINANACDENINHSKSDEHVNLKKSNDSNACDNSDKLPIITVNNSVLVHNAFIEDVLCTSNVLLQPGFMNVPDDCISVEEINENIDNGVFQNTDKRNNNDNVIDIKNTSIIIEEGPTNKWSSRGWMKIDLNLKINWCYEDLRSAIRNALITAHHPCVLTFKTANTNKQRLTVTQYAKCKYKIHPQKFKFVVNNQNIMEIYTIGPDTRNHGEIKEFTQLRGKARSKMQDQLVNLHANLVSLRQLNVVDVNLLEQGNTQTFVAPVNVRKARSERKLITDLVKSCEVMDAIRRYDSQPREDLYIYSVSDPLSVTLIRDLAFKFLHENNVTVHVDATGSLIRNPKCCQTHNYNKIFYYACVVKINDITFPIAELITAKHDTPTLNKFFCDLKSKLNGYKPKVPFPKLFVTDWSWVFINSILQEINVMTIKEYLNFSYSVILGKTQLKDVGVFICCSHFAAIIIRQIKKRLPNCSKNLRDTIMIILFLILDSDNMKDIDEFFEIICILGCSKFETTIFNDTLKLLEDKIRGNIDSNNCKDPETRESELSENDIDELYSPLETELDDTPFFQRYNSILTNVLIKLRAENQEGAPNKLYCEDFIIFCTKRYMKYLPLWATIYLRKFGYPKRISNALIESWFNILKHNLINELHLKVGRFIDTLREKTLLILKSVECAPHLKHSKKIAPQLEFRSKAYISTPTSCRADEKNPSDSDNEENWRRINKRSDQKYSGKRASQRFVNPKRINFSSISKEYYQKMTDLNFNVVIFKFRFHDLWESCLYNFGYCTLTNINSWLSTEIVYIAISVLIRAGNSICLDEFQVAKILSKRSVYEALDEKLQPELKLANNRQFVIFPLCENNHWTLGVVDFEKSVIITYDSMKPETNLKVMGNQIRCFINQLLAFYNKPPKHFKIKCCGTLPKQQDAYNCGVYTIYAADYIVNGKRIEQIHSEKEKVNRVALNEYRNYLSEIVAENSESMADDCMFCYDKLNNCQTAQCLTCKRKIHKDCNKEILIINNECRFNDKTIRENCINI